MYNNTLRRLRDAVRRKRLEKKRTIIWFLLHDNAAVHRSFLVKDFLPKNNTTTLENHPHRLIWLQLIFFLFPRLKSAFKGRNFCDPTDIIKNATEELKRRS